MKSQHEDFGYQDDPERAKWNHSEPRLKPDLSIRINQYMIEDWGDHCTVNGKRSEYDYLETVQRLSQGIKDRFDVKLEKKF